jgi:site-specific recombinase XerD
MNTPKIVNAVYNRELHAIGIACGISTRLHSHLARHTFATYMLRHGVKLENVSRMLGHTNIRQTLRYAKVLAEDVHRDFEKIEEQLKRPL